MNNSEQKSLTTKGTTLWYTLFILNSLLILGVTLYLTSHYFEMVYPLNGLSNNSSLCDISSFFNCDSATFSSVASFFNIPTSIFGFCIGIIFILGSIFPSLEMEKNLKTISVANALGCLFFLVYSLVILKSLCPFCTAYYFLSFFACLILLKFGVSGFAFSPKHLTLFGVFFIGISGGTYLYQKDTIHKMEQLSSAIAQKFKELPSYGDPKIDSGFDIYKSTQNFSDAPLRLAIFSDFQCPYCKVLSKQIPSIIKAFPQKLNIKYYFYPLDSGCNAGIEAGHGHEFACRAAYVAICSKEKFVESHDEIFENQEKLDDKFINELVTKYTNNDCMNDKSTKEVVLKTISAGEQFKLKSTPTFILNGVKIEGVLPTIQIINLMKEIMKK